MTPFIFVAVVATAFLLTGWYMTSMTKTPRHTVYRSLLAAYIWFWLFLAVSSVGDPIEDCQPIGAQFPLTLLIFLSVPTLFGFLSVRKP